MIPVTGGNIAPPKKRTNHKQTPNTLKSTKGIGKANTTARVPKKHYSFYALTVL